MKRLVDLTFSVIALFLLGWLLVVCFIICSIETKSLGIFVQQRVGRHGKLFKIYKLKTISTKAQKVAFFGSFFRKYKIDELPQLWNILIGEMSFVGPRPDIPGYYDLLEGENRKILLLKPGLTCEASLKYFDEEQILSQQDNSLVYNDTVIFPDKVAMNLDYYYNRSFVGDLLILWKTVFGVKGLRDKVNEKK